MAIPDSTRPPEHEMTPEEIRARLILLDQKDDEGVMTVAEALERDDLATIYQEITRG